jgi:hypothetical protein
VNVIGANSSIFTKVLVSNHTFNGITLESGFVASSVSVRGIWKSSVMSSVLNVIVMMFVLLVSSMLSDEMNIVRSNSDVFTKVFVSNHTSHGISTISDNITSSSCVWLIRKGSGLSMMVSFGVVNGISSNSGIFTKVFIIGQSGDSITSIDCFNSIARVIWKGSGLSMMVMLFGIMNGIGSNSGIFTEVFVVGQSSNGISSIDSINSITRVIWESLQESMIFANLVVDLSKSLCHSIKFQTLFWAFQLFFLSNRKFI